MVHFPSENTQPGSVKTVADILTAAAELIEPEGAWTQGCFARASDGRQTGWRMAEAACFCVAGAINRVGGDLSPSGLAAFKNAPGCTWNIGEWNDAPERTQVEVVAALRAAAEKARTASSLDMEPKHSAECAQQPPLRE